MKALEIEKGTVFSIDGGETWLVAIVEPRDGDYEDITVLAAPRESPSLGSAFEIKLTYYQHVWAPDPEALNRGDNYLSIKEE